MKQKPVAKRFYKGCSLFNYILRLKGRENGTYLVPVVICLIFEGKFLRIILSFHGNSNKDRFLVIRLFVARNTIKKWAENGVVGKGVRVSKTRPLNMRS